MIYYIHLFVAYATPKEMLEIPILFAYPKNLSSLIYFPEL